MSKVYDVVAIVGKRKDDKPNYVKVGAVFQNDKGMSMKLDSIPAGGEWNGWLNFFEPKERSSATSAAIEREAASFSDDTPF
jgi:hypothetical protein